MYSVIRFTGSPRESDSVLSGIAESINARRPGTFTGMDKVDQRFSCTVSKRDSVDEHMVQILHFLRLFNDILKDASKKGVELQLDIAIEPEDREPEGKETETPYSFLLNKEVMAEMSRSDVKLALTIY